MSCWRTVCKPGYIWASILNVGTELRKSFPDSVIALALLKKFSSFNVYSNYLNHQCVSKLLQNVQNEKYIHVYRMPLPAENDYLRWNRTTQIFQFSSQTKYHQKLQNFVNHKMTFFPAWNKYFKFHWRRENVTVWVFLRKKSSSYISVIIDIALQSVKVLK